METIVFGGGCFWCTEAIFKELRGVTKVEPGYSGGTTKNPTYEQVSDGTTGHAEVVRITFDPQIISLSDLLDVFWHTHNPTTRNQQGYDVGTEYRSIILYSNDQQRAVIEEQVAALQKSGEFKDPIVTEIKPLVVFYPAENYHQDFYTKHSDDSYCQVIISPKLRHLRQQYSRLVT